MKYQKSKIGNWKLEIGNYAKRSGFTLLEVLIVVLLTAVVTTIASTSFFSLLQGAAKTETIKEVKQNGDYAVSVIEVKLRNARNITSICDGSSSNTITIANPDSSQSVFSCATSGTVRRIQETNTPLPPPSPTSNYLTGQSVTVYQDCTPANFSIICTTEADGKSKTVAVSFRLSQGATNTTVSETALETFSTRVNLRNK